MFSDWVVDMDFNLYLFATCFQLNLMGFIQVLGICGGWFHEYQAFVTDDWFQWMSVFSNLVDEHNEHGCSLEHHH